MKLLYELAPSKITDSNAIPSSGLREPNVEGIERVLSVMGGAALATWGIKNIQRPFSWPLLISGGFMLLRGATGYCPINSSIIKNQENKKALAAKATGTYIVNHPRQDVYRFWRQLENLPQFMHHLEEVKNIDNIKTSWKAVFPGTFAPLSWEAEILEDRPGEYLSWSSLPGSTVESAGSVAFTDAPGNATVLEARIAYRLPSVDINIDDGSSVNSLLEAIIAEDVGRFKSRMETIVRPDHENKKPLTDKTKSTERNRLISDKFLRMIYPQN